MPLVLADRVNETTTTTSTGTITLAGAVSGYQSFAVIGNGNTTYYTIVHQTANEWEVGIGTYTSSGTLLSRDTVLSSSNSGSLVNFSAGTKFVFCDYPAGRAVYLDTATNVTIPGLTLSGGTANGVLYLNGSKVATSGSALTFDGTDFATTGGVRLNNAQYYYGKNAAGSAVRLLGVNAGNVNYVGAIDSGPTEVNYGAASTITAQYWNISGSEQMRLTSTGLGIGTASPGVKLDVVGAIRSSTTTSGSTVSATTDFRLNNATFSRVAIGDGGGGFVGGYNITYSSGAVYSDTGSISGIYHTNGGNIQFYAGGSAAGGTAAPERMRLDSSGNLLVGTTAGGAAGIAIPTNFNYSFSEGSNNSYANFFRQVNTAAAVLAHGYKRSATSGFASSIGVSVSRAAIAVGYDNGAISFFSDTATNVANGTDVTPTERMRIDSAGRFLLGASSNTSRGGSNTTALFYKASGTQYLDIQTGTSGDSGIVFSATSSSAYGLINYSNSVNAMLFYANSAEVFRITSSGNVGIGTSSPVERLQVSGGGLKVTGTSTVASGSGAGLYLNYVSGSNYGEVLALDQGVAWKTLRLNAADIHFYIAGGEQMRLNTSGNLGIGTASPATRLDVQGPFGAESSIRITSPIDGSAVTPAGSFFSFRSGSALRETARIASLNQFANFNGGNLVFSTADTSNVLQNRATIDSSGNLGIGTASPSAYLSGTAKLVAYANANAQNSILVRNDSSGASASCAIALNASGNTWGIEIGSSAKNSNALTFQLDYGGTNAEKMRLTSGGDLLVGTTSAAYSTAGRGLIELNGSSDSLLALKRNNTSNFYIHNYSSGIDVWNTANTFIRFATNATERVRLTSGGDLCVGTTAAISVYGLIHVRGDNKGIAIQDSTDDSYRAIYNQSGTLYFYNGTNEGYLSTAGAWVDASDVRLKENIVPIKHGLDSVMKSQPRSYKMKDGNAEYVGFIAQEMLDVIPECVSGKPEKQLGISYGSLVAVAFKAIQEQQAMIMALKAELDQLKGVH